MRSIKLTYGAGSPTKGACWMSAIRMYEGGSWGDQPDCVCPVIRWLCIHLNDSFGKGADADRERGAFIGPHLFTVVGTRGSLAIMLKRAFLCADRAVRVFAPPRLRAVGHEAEALKLESLSPITDRETALAGLKAAESAAAAAADSFAAAAAGNAAAAAAFSAAAAADDADYFAVTAAAFAASAAFYGYAVDADEDAAVAAAADRPSLLRLILDLCAIDDRRPIEPACPAEKVLEYCAAG